MKNIAARSILLWAVSVMLLGVAVKPCGAAEYARLERHVDLAGLERTYYVALPEDYDAGAVYWALVVIHGGGGNARTNPKAIAMRRIADEAKLPAILILPECITEDKQVSRFPVLGEGAFLEAVLRDARGAFRLHEKILLNGYSMGGQFSHRFALAHPEMVQACAAFAAGTWTTPDGRFLVEEFGEVAHPETFLAHPENAAKVPERLADLFDARVAAVAGTPAAAGAKAVPFLVMCGTLDTRLSIAREFAASLKEQGFQVETAWPKTPHASKEAAYQEEFERYPEAAIRFFKKCTETAPGE